MMLDFKPLLQFLTALDRHNNKPWFDANRNAYEKAKAINLEFAAILIQEVGKWDDGVALLQPKECVFRINRDVRFSKNKDPYKNNMSVYLAPGGKKAERAGYYIHLQPSASFVAGGFYQPNGDQLAKIRQEIDYNLAEWESILQKKSFRNTFPKGLDRADALKKAPRGYEPDHPGLAHLQLKSFVAQAPIADEDVLQKSFIKNVVKSFQTLQPLISFLNRAVDDEG